MPHYNRNDADADTVIQTGHGAIRRYADDGQGTVINITTRRRRPQPPRHPHRRAR